MLATRRCLFAGVYGPVEDISQLVKVECLVDEGELHNLLPELNGSQGCLRRMIAVTLAANHVDFVRLSSYY